MEQIFVFAEMVFNTRRIFDTISENNILII